VWLPHVHSSDRLIAKLKNLKYVANVILITYERYCLTTSEENCLNLNSNRKQICRIVTRRDHQTLVLVTSTSGSNLGGLRFWNPLPSLRDSASQEKYLNGSYPTEPLDTQHLKTHLTATLSPSTRPLIKPRNVNTTRPLTQELPTTKSIFIINIRNIIHSPPTDGHLSQF
jgi:hypothetical protein